MDVASLSTMLILVLYRYSFVVIGQGHAALMFQPATNASHKFLAGSAGSSIATFPPELFCNKGCSVRYFAILLRSSVSDWSPHLQHTQKYILALGLYKKLCWIRLAFTKFM